MKIISARALSRRVSFCVFPSRDGIVLELDTLRIPLTPEQATALADGLIDAIERDG